jgi:glycerophosphoryl diester phosphodiesterase
VPARKGDGVIEVTGHRGAIAVHPENTLAAFSYAIALGCDRLELDVWLTADGRPVVIHDETVDRTTDGTGAVADLSFAEIRRLEAGQGERIPSLDEVLDLAHPTAITLQIEVKGPDTERVAPMSIRRHRMATRIVFTSFDHDRARVAKELLPGARSGILVRSYPADPLGLLSAVRADELHAHASWIDDPLVRKVHDGGKRLSAWGGTVDLLLIRKLIALGVDAIGSDDPARVIACLREAGLREDRSPEPVG